jgi:hypothetical protein
MDRLPDSKSTPPPIVKRRPFWSRGYTLLLALLGALGLFAVSVSIFVRTPLASPVGGQAPVSAPSLSVPSRIPRPVASPSLEEPFLSGGHSVGTELAEGDAAVPPSTSRDTSPEGSCPPPQPPPRRWHGVIRAVVRTLQNKIPVLHPHPHPSPSPVVCPPPPPPPPSPPPPLDFTGGGAGAAPSARGSGKSEPDFERTLKSLTVKGQAYFEMPADMQLNVPQTAFLTVGQELRDQLTTALKGHRGTLKSLLIGSSMKATLVGGDPSALEIVAASGAEEQQIFSDAPAKWRWYVTPRVAGLHPLTLSLVVTFKDRPPSVEPPLFDRDVTVSSDPAYQVKRVISANWQWFAGLLIGSGAARPIGRWWKRIRSRIRRRATRTTTSG